MRPESRFKRALRSNWLFFLALILLWAGIRAWQRQDMVDGPLPVARLTTLDGQTLALSEMPRPYLIHFTASWCPICQAQRDTMQALQKDWPVIRIIVQSGDLPTAREYARAHRMPPNKTVNDPNGRLLALFGAHGVPADFFVGRDGRIRLHEMGYTSLWGYRLRLWWLAQ